MAKVNRKELLEVLKKVTKIVPSGGISELLKGLLVEVGESQMKLSATNITTTIIGRIPCETGFIATEKYIVNAKLFLDIVSKISSEDVEMTYSENKVTIKGEKSVFKIVTAGEVALFPDVNKNIADKQSITMDSSILKELVNKTIRFASDDEDRPTLKGVKLEFTKNQVKGVSLDGFRLAHYVAEIESEKEVNFIIDAFALSNIAKSLDKNEITISYSDNVKLIEFDLGDTVIFSSILEGEYINYKGFMDIEKHKTKLSIDSKELKSAIERVNIMARNGGALNPIILTFKDDTLIVSTTNEIGGVTEKLSLEEVEGEKLDLRIAFNPKYLLDGMNVMASEKVQVRVNGAVNPAYLIDEDANFIYLILPIRLREVEVEEEEVA